MRAIVRAFGGDKQGPASADDDDEAIDTTDPQFAESFTGFTGQPALPLQQQRPPMNTEIKFG